MTRVLHRSGAARGLFLARFLVFLVLTAGGLMLFAPPCGDGMAVAMPAASADSPKYTAAIAGDAQPMIAQRGGFPEPDAVLLACIAILVAVLVAVLGPRRPVTSPGTTASLFPAGHRAFGCPPRRPVLAELCVLRA